AADADLQEDAQARLADRLARVRLQGQVGSGQDGEVRGRGRRGLSDPRLDGQEGGRRRKTHHRGHKAHREKTKTEKKKTKEKNGLGLFSSLSIVFVFSLCALW